MPSITAILPAYNEEVAIGSVVLRARQHADRVLVVDDGSQDRTAEVAELAGAEVIRHAENMGKGAALRTGFAAADGADVIVTIDTDGQHSLTEVSSSCAPDGAQLDPADIPKLVAPILAGEAEMVNGSRYLNGNKRDTTLYRRLGQRVLDFATNLDSGLSVTDSQSGFRAFAGGVRDVFSFRQDGLAIESEMLADAAQADARRMGPSAGGLSPPAARRARAMVEREFTYENNG